MWSQGVSHCSHTPNFGWEVHASSSLSSPTDQHKLRLQPLLSHSSGAQGMSTVTATHPFVSPTTELSEGLGLGRSWEEGGANGSGTHPLGSRAVQKQELWPDLMLTSWWAQDTCRALGKYCDYVLENSLCMHHFFPPSNSHPPSCNPRSTYAVRELSQDMGDLSSRSFLALGDSNVHLLFLRCLNSSSSGYKTVYGRLWCDLEVCQNLLPPSDFFMMTWW